MKEFENINCKYHKESGLFVYDNGLILVPKKIEMKLFSSLFKFYTN